MSYLEKGFCMINFFLIEFGLEVEYLPFWSLHSLIPGVHISNLEEKKYKLEIRVPLNHIHSPEARW